MAVRIRLKRFGKKKQPFYRVVIAESSTPRDGKTIETVGLYDPRQEPVRFEMKKDRVEHWLSVGAIPTDTVYRLLSNEGVVPKKEVKSSQLGISKKDRQKAEA